MFQIGLSSCGKPFGAELFCEYKKAGIEAMEISLSKKECDVFDFAQAKKLSMEYGVRLWSFHLPFMPFNKIDISSPKLCRKTVPYLCEMIKKGAFYGIKTFIIHPSGEPIDRSEREMRLITAMESLSVLSQTAAENGAVLAIENLPRTCLGRNSAEIMRLLQADGELRVCFDTNHLLCETHADFIKAVGDKIVTTHISDYDFIDEKHWLPGEGKVDWPSLAALLKKANYSGVWMYELGFSAPQSLFRSRSLTCKDFVCNANEIFSGSALTRIK